MFAGKSAVMSRAPSSGHENVEDKKSSLTLDLLPSSSTTEVKNVEKLQENEFREPQSVAKDDGESGHISEKAQQPIAPSSSQDKKTGLTMDPLSPKPCSKTEVISVDQFQETEFREPGAGEDLPENNLSKKSTTADAKEPLSNGNKEHLNNTSSNTFFVKPTKSPSKGSILPSSNLRRRVSLTDTMKTEPLVNEEHPRDPSSTSGMLYPSNIKTIDPLKPTRSDNSEHSNDAASCTAKKKVKDNALNKKVSLPLDLSCNPLAVDSNEIPTEHQLPKNSEGSNKYLGTSASNDDLHSSPLVEKKESASNDIISQNPKAIPDESAETKPTETLGRSGEFRTQGAGSIDAKERQLNSNAECVSKSLSKSGSKDKICSLPPVENKEGTSTGICQLPKINPDDSAEVEPEGALGRSNEYSLPVIQNKEGSSGGIRPDHKIITDDSAKAEAKMTLGRSDEFPSQGRPLLDAKEGQLPTNVNCSKKSSVSSGSNDKLHRPPLTGNNEDTSNDISERPKSIADELAETKPKEILGRSGEFRAQGAGSIDVKDPQLNSNAECISKSLSTSGSRDKICSLPPVENKEGTSTGICQLPKLNPDDSAEVEPKGALGRSNEYSLPVIQNKEGSSGGIRPDHKIITDDSAKVEAKMTVGRSDEFPSQGTPLLDSKEPQLPSNVECSKKSSSDSQHPKIIPDKSAESEPKETLGRSREFRSQGAGSFDATERQSNNSATALSKSSSDSGSNNNLCNLPPVENKKATSTAISEHPKIIMDKSAETDPKETQRRSGEFPSQGKPLLEAKERQLSKNTEGTNKAQSNLEPDDKSYNPPLVEKEERASNGISQNSEIIPDESRETEPKKAQRRSGAFRAQGAGSFDATERQLNASAMDSSKSSSDSDLNNNFSSLPSVINKEGASNDFSQQPKINMEDSTETDPKEALGRSGEFPLQRRPLLDAKEGQLPTNVNCSKKSSVSSGCNDKLHRPPLTGNNEDTSNDISERPKSIADELAETKPKEILGRSGEFRAQGAGSIDVKEPQLNSNAECISKSLSTSGSTDKICSLPPVENKEGTLSGVCQLQITAPNDPSNTEPNETRAGSDNFPTKKAALLDTKECQLDNNAGCLNKPASNAGAIDTSYSSPLVEHEENATNDASQLPKTKVESVIQKETLEGSEEFPSHGAALLGGKECQLINNVECSDQFLTIPFSNDNSCSSNLLEGKEGAQNDICQHPNTIPVNVTDAEAKEILGHSEEFLSHDGTSDGIPPLSETFSNDSAVAEAEDTLGRWERFVSSNEEALACINAMKSQLKFNPQGRDTLEQWEKFVSLSTAALTSIDAMKFRLKCNPPSTYKPLSTSATIPPLRTCSNKNGQRSVESLTRCHLPLSSQLPRTLSDDSAVAEARETLGRWANFVSGNTPTLMGIDAKKFQLKCALSILDTSEKCSGKPLSGSSTVPAVRTCSNDKKQYSQEVPCGSTVVEAKSNPLNRISKLPETPTIPTVRPCSNDKKQYSQEVPCGSTVVEAKSNPLNRISKLPETPTIPTVRTCSNDKKQYSQEIPCGPTVVEAKSNPLNRISKLPKILPDASTVGKGRGSHTNRIVQFPKTFPGGSTTNEAKKGLGLSELPSCKAALFDAKERQLKDTVKFSDKLGKNLCRTDNSCVSSHVAKNEVNSNTIPRRPKILLSDSGIAEDEEPVQRWKEFCSNGTVLQDGVQCQLKRSAQCSNKVVSGSPTIPALRTRYKENQRYSEESCNGSPIVGAEENLSNDISEVSNTSSDDSDMVKVQDLSNDTPQPSNISLDNAAVVRAKKTLRSWEEFCSYSAALIDNIECQLKHNAKLSNNSLSNASVIPALQTGYDGSTERSKDDSCSSIVVGAKESSLKGGVSNDYDLPERMSRSNSLEICSSNLTAVDPPLIRLKGNSRQPTCNSTGFGTVAYDMGRSSVRNVPFPRDHSGALVTIDAMKVLSHKNSTRNTIVAEEVETDQATESDLRGRSGGGTLQTDESSHRLHNDQTMTSHSDENFRQPDELLSEDECLTQTSSEKIIQKSAGESCSNVSDQRPDECLSTKQLLPGDSSSTLLEEEVSEVCSYENSQRLDKSSSMLGTEQCSEDPSRTNFPHPDCVTIKIVDFHPNINTWHAVDPCGPSARPGCKSEVKIYVTPKKEPIFELIGGFTVIPPSGKFNKNEVTENNLSRDNDGSCSSADLEESSAIEQTSECQSNSDASNQSCESATTGAIENENQPRPNHSQSEFSMARSEGSTLHQEESSCGLEVFKAMIEQNSECHSNSDDSDQSRKSATTEATLNDIRPCPTDSHSSFLVARPGRRAKIQEESSSMLATSEAMTGEATDCHERSIAFNRSCKSVITEATGNEIRPGLNQSQNKYLSTDHAKKSAKHQQKPSCRLTEVAECYYDSNAFDKSCESATTEAMENENEPGQNHSQSNCLSTAHSKRKATPQEGSSCKLAAREAMTGKARECHEYSNAFDQSCESATIGVMENENRSPPNLYQNMLSPTCLEGSTKHQEESSSRLAESEAMTGQARECHEYSNAFDQSCESATTGVMENENRSPPNQYQNMLSPTCLEGSTKHQEASSSRLAESEEMPGPARECHENSNAFNQSCKSATTEAMETENRPRPNYSLSHLSTARSEGSTKHHEESSCRLETSKAMNEQALECHSNSDDSNQSCTSATSEAVENENRPGPNQSHSNLSTARSEESSKHQESSCRSATSEANIGQVAERHENSNGVTESCKSVTAEAMGNENLPRPNQSHGTLSTARSEESAKHQESSCRSATSEANVGQAAECHENANSVNQSCKSVTSEAISNENLPRPNQSHSNLLTARSEESAKPQESSCRSATSEANVGQAAECHENVNGVDQSCKSVTPEATSNENLPRPNQSHSNLSTARSEGSTEHEGASSNRLTTSEAMEEQALECYAILDALNQSCKSTEAMANENRPRPNHSRSIILAAGSDGNLMQQRQSCRAILSEAMNNSFDGFIESPNGPGEIDVKDHRCSIINIREQNDQRDMSAVTRACNSKVAVEVTPEVELKYEDLEAMTPSQSPDYPPDFPDPGSPSNAAELAKPEVLTCLTTNPANPSVSGPRLEDDPLWEDFDQIKPVSDPDNHPKDCLNYSTKPNQDSCTKPNQDSSTKPNQISSTKPNQYSSTKPNQNSSTKPNQYSSTKPNQNSSTKPNQYSSTKPNQYSSTKPNQDSSTKPNQDSSTKPNQESRCLAEKIRNLHESELLQCLNEDPHFLMLSYMLVMPKGTNKPLSTLTLQDKTWIVQELKRGMSDGQSAFIDRLLHLISELDEW